MRTSADHPKKVVLALQGGAALGAFGWGVLDRLLQDDRLNIEGVSGTSSGAVNAALLAYGMIGGDRDQARTLLAKFWARISEESEQRRWGRLRSLRLLGSQILQFRRKEVFFEVMSRILLPYQFDPVTMDPLRAVIDESIDFDRLRSSDTISLFVNATNIATNKNRVFARDEVSLDALCASCCLPFLFDAVTIDAEQYWDGGYMGNPTIYPLINDDSPLDIILVLTSNLESRIEPKTSAEIVNRVSQVSFTSALMREMRAIKFVTELLDNGFVKPEAGLRRVNIHIIAPKANDPEFDSVKNFNADWHYMKRMKENGSQTADAWLQESFSKIGHRSSVDLEAMFC
ncbi:MAG: patatin-like phospholipase family protein [Hyphomicrobiaceae bacterium]